MYIFCNILTSCPKGSRRCHIYTLKMVGWNWLVLNIFDAYLVITFIEFSFLDKNLFPRVKCILYSLDGFSYWSERHSLLLYCVQPVYIVSTDFSHGYKFMDIGQESVQEFRMREYNISVLVYLRLTFIINLNNKLTK